MDGWMDLSLFFGILMMLGGCMGRSEFSNKLAKRFFVVVALAGLIIVVWVIAMCYGMTSVMKT
jgi:hypothetical protein